MKVLICGGGSGGHIVPSLAVAHAIKQHDGATEVDYLIPRNDKLSYLPEQDESITSVYKIRSGKFRRFHGQGIKQLLDIPTLMRNIRDFFYVLVGIVQAFNVLGKSKPDIILIKGGSVGVPAGIAARLRRIPFITHDSDAVPGLTNRIIGRWAAKHATGMPPDYYPYPKEKIIYTGVPSRNTFTTVTPAQQAEFKRTLGIPEQSKLILVTGGGLGAVRLNTAFASIAAQLMYRHTDVYVYHLSGQVGYEELKMAYAKLDPDYQARITLKDFIPDLHVASGAADLIVARAGATTIAEFALQHKACVIVPNAMLTGGHQLKNAQELESKGAVVIVKDEVATKNPEVLLAAIETLLKDEAARISLGAKLGELARPNAAKDLAELVLSGVSSRG